MYIPSITSIENALKIFYENGEIGNKEISIGYKTSLHDFYTIYNKKLSLAQSSYVQLRIRLFFLPAGCHLNAR